MSKLFYIPLNQFNVRRMAMPGDTNTAGAAGSPFISYNTDTDQWLFYKDRQDLVPLDLSTIGGPGFVYPGGAATLESEVDALQADSHVAATAADNTLDLTGQAFSVAFSSDAGNAASVGTDGKVFVPAALLDLNTTVSDQTGGNYGGGAPVNAPASPDSGDLHIEIYDDLVAYFVAVASAFPSVATATAPLTSGNLYTANGTLTGPRTVDGTGPFPGFNFPVSFTNMGGFTVDSSSAVGSSLLDSSVGKSYLNFSNGTESGGVYANSFPDASTKVGYSSTSGSSGSTHTEYSAAAMDLQFDGLAEMRLDGAPGAAGEVFTSGGVGAPPTWTSVGANDRVHADDATVSPAAAGEPTLTEISAFATAGNHTDTVLYYTGDDLPASAPTYVYHVDNSGAVTLLQSPSSSESLYTADGTLTGARIVDTAGTSVEFSTGNLRLDPVVIGRGFVSAGQVSIEQVDESTSTDAQNFDILPNSFYNITLTGAAATATIGHATFVVSGQYEEDQLKTAVKINNFRGTTATVTFGAEFKKRGASRPALGAVVVQPNSSRTIRFDAVGYAPAVMDWVVSYDSDETAAGGLTQQGLLTSDSLSGQGIYSVDASGAAFDVTLPAATGSQDRYMFSGQDLSNNATIKVQAGESLNGATDGTYTMSTNGELLLAIDEGVGNYRIQVLGAGSSTDLAYGRMTKDGAADVANDIGTHASPVKAVFGAAQYSKLITANPTTGEFTVNQAGSYRPRYFQAAENRNDDTIAYLFLNGTEIDSISSQIQAEENIVALFAKVDLVAGDVLDVRLGGATVDAVGDQNRPGVTEYFELEQVPSKQMVLAGMVTPTPLHRFYGQGVPVPDSADGQAPISTLSTLDDPDSLLVGDTVVIKAAGLYRLEMSVDRGGDGDSALDVAEILVDSAQVANSHNGDFADTQRFHNWASPAQCFWEGQLSVGQVVEFQSEGNTYRGAHFAVRQLSTSTVQMIDNGTPVTEWTDFPMVIGGTNNAPTKGTTTQDRARYKVVGKTLHIRYELEQSGAGASGSGNYLFPLPAGFTADMDVLTGNLQSFQVLNGSVAANDGGTFAYGIPRWRSDHNAIDLAAGNPNSFVGIGSSFYSLSGAGTSFSFTADIPIL